MPVSRPIGRIGHIRTYLPRIRRACLLDGDGERTWCARAVYSYPLVQLCRTPLRAPPLCFFVRAKIINGQTEVRYPEVSASWQWRSSHLESTLSVFLLPLLCLRLRINTVRYRVWLRLTPWVIATETALWHDLQREIVIGVSRASSCYFTIRLAVSMITIILNNREYF